jgi:hypothetical protein
MQFRTFAELKIDMLNSDRASVVVAETTFEISWRWIVRVFLFSSLRLLSANNEEYPEKSQQDRAIREVAAQLPSYLRRFAGIQRWSSRARPRTCRAIPRTLICGRMPASADDGNTRSAKVSMNSVAHAIGSYGQALLFQWMRQRAGLL